MALIARLALILRQLKHLLHVRSPQLASVVLPQCMPLAVAISSALMPFGSAWKERMSSTKRQAGGPAAAARAWRSAGAGRIDGQHARRIPDARTKCKSPSSMCVGQAAQNWNGATETDILPSDDCWTVKLISFEAFVSPTVTDMEPLHCSVHLSSLVDVVTILSPRRYNGCCFDFSASELASLDFAIAEFVAAYLPAHYCGRPKQPGARPSGFRKNRTQAWRRSR